MDFLRNLAHSILGSQPEPNDSPTAEDRDAAEAMNELIHDESVWQEGVDMGTIPRTPPDGEYQNTDPDIEAAKKPDPWHRQFMPW